MSRCSVCRAERELEQLIRVVPRREPWRWRHVCRPRGRSYCFTDSVGPASLERIEDATNPPPAAMEALSR